MIFGDHNGEEQSWLSGMTGECTPKCWSVSEKILNLPRVTSYPNISMKNLSQNVAKSDAFVFNAQLTNRS